MLIDLGQPNNYGILLEIIGFLLLIPFFRNIFIFYDYWKTIGKDHYHTIIENYETHDLPPNTKIKTRKEIFYLEIICYFSKLWQGSRDSSSTYKRSLLLRHKNFEKILQFLGIFLVIFGLIFQFN